jgi:hypothetical protein
MMEYRLLRPYGGYTTYWINPLTSGFDEIAVITPLLIRTL